MDGPLSVTETPLRRHGFTGGGLAGTLGLILLGTALSILFTGYIPYFNNNIYHLPILRADYDLPQFAGDAFVQSLKHFASGFWIVFADSARMVDPKVFLMVAFVLSRALMMAASFHLAASLGYRGRLFQLAFVVLIAISPLARGNAPGDGGLNIEYFSHSEVANAVLILSLSALARRQFALSVFLACLTFFLNAFMAVWLAPLWLAGVFMLRQQERLNWRRFLLQCFLGTLLGLPLVLLVLRAVAGGSGVAEPEGYSYAGYLRGFYPFHFFLDSLRPVQLRMIGWLCLVLLLLSRLIRQGRLFLALSLAAMAVLAVGSLVPLLTESRLLLNLHFIRSAVLLQLLAILGLSMLAAEGMTSEQDRHDRVLGLLLACLLVLGAPALPGVILLMVYRLWISGRIRLTILDQPITLRVAQALLCLTVASTVPFTLLPLWKDMRTQWWVAGEWEKAGLWVHDHTPLSSTMLLPVAEEPMPAGTERRARYLDHELSAFIATAGRPAWTNYKFGASPMWEPRTFALWRKRYDAVLALTDAASRLDYARANGISHVATFCDPALSIMPVYRSGSLCIYQAVP